ncbi:hypothetical protein FO519_006990 [Halicephalobus sp. NKZ332]|nr:hypothetical protein FO519_006990 [Halicephalobus sp. NKZ332]
MKQSELLPRKISFSVHDYTKLKELWSAIQHSQTQCDEKRKSFSDAINEEEEFRSASSIIQNRQIRLRIYREQIKQAKVRIINAQMRLTAIEEVKEKRIKEELELSSIAEDLRKKCGLEVENLVIKKIPMTKLRNELIFRRRYMLFELYMIYFAETSMDRKQDKVCPCTKFDTIRGMHLPITASKNGHNEIEITAALGHLVNAINVFCKITDYQPLFPMFFKGSKSFLLEPKQHQIYNLFDPFSRSHRERYAQAILFFNRSINQLRYDLGISTKDYERPIQNFQELLLYCIGQINQPPAHFVPRDSLFSVSSVVPDYQKVSSSDRSGFQSSVKLRRSMEDDQSILDVVSAKNETFDMADCPESSSALEASTSESPSVAANVHHSHSLVEDDEEEILLVPRFKYKRLLSSMPDKDTISCFAIHDKFIAVGCGSGKIRIFDILGNLRSEFTARKHKCAVSQIAVDKSGSYLISCANDSTVSIMGVGCTEFNYTVQLGQSARSVAIAEDFVRRGCQRFAIGERRLLVYEKGFFIKYSEKIIYEGKEKDGFISAVSWKGDNLAFTNETGTRIYDFKLHKLLILIQPLHTPEPYYSSRFPPQHSWFDENTLAIGWGSTVIVAGIKMVSEQNETSMKKIEVINRVRLNNIHIAGISFTTNPISKNGERNWKEIAIFGIKIIEQKKEKVDEESDSTISQHSGKSVAQSVMAVPVNPGQNLSVILLLILPSSVDRYIVAAEDEISMKQQSQTFLRQFHLGAIPDDSVYYLLGPMELIEAKPCSVDDKITWFLENGFYVEATNCAITHKDELVENTVSEVGKTLIEELINKGDFETAASYLPSICGKHKEEWEFYVGLFEKPGQVLKLVPYLPQKQPQLEPECYESILISALYCKAGLFLKLINLLSSDLYRIGAIIQSTLARLKQQLPREERIQIIQALARLFAHERQFDKALALYLQLKDTGIFSFIRQYHLFEAVKERVVELMEINADMAIRLLLDHETEIADSKIIVPQLGKMPKLQMEYLNQLTQRGEGAEYADLLVKLFAENSSERLLPFLRKSDSYDLDKAIEVCKKNKLQHELVFLLGRSGNRLAALETIVEQMGRIDLGIEFCAEHADPDLWQRLIELSMTKPEHVTKVLTVAGTFVDPLLVVEKIPPKMEVPNLQTSLHKVLRDSELQVSLIRDCQATSLTDVYERFEKFINRPAVFINNWNECLVCGKPLLSSQTDILLQGCGHQFHAKCVKIPEINPFDDKNEELCKRTSFLGFSKNDPGPPSPFCPICNKNKLRGDENTEYQIEKG